jgi:hypothetical protein
VLSVFISYWFFDLQKGQWGYCDPDCNYNGTILPTADDPINTCGSAVTFGFIVGGHFAKKGAYPFIAALGVKNTKNPEKLDIIYICGGSLINRRYVVTVGFNVIDLHSLSLTLCWQNSYECCSWLAFLAQANSLLVEMEHTRVEKTSMSLKVVK